MRTRDEVIRAFTPAGKLADGERMRVLKIEKAFIDLATDILDLCPENADRTAGLRKLLEVKRTVTQSITHQVVAPAPAKESK